MCQNRRCASVPATEWIELVFEYANGTTRRERHSEAAGVMMTNILGDATAIEQTGHRVWWADEFDAAATPVWTAVGTRGPLQLMSCSLHGEYAYQQGMGYFRDGQGTCCACQVAGKAPRLAELENAPF